MIDETYIRAEDGRVVLAVEEVTTVGSYTWVRGEDGNIYKLNTHDLDWDQNVKLIPGIMVESCDCGRPISSTVRNKDHQYVCKCEMIWMFDRRTGQFTKREE